MKIARAKRAKMLFFIVKNANLWGFCCRRRGGKLPVSRSFIAWPFFVFKKTVSSYNSSDATLDDTLDKNEAAKRHKTHLVKFCPF